MGSFSDAGHFSKELGSEHPEIQEKGRLFDVMCALVLLIVCAPLVAIICVVILVRDGRPILYRGKRIGRDKKLFTIYKFRTLAPDAQQKLGPTLVNDSDRLVTLTGSFLRPTRLDELPQLVNVIRGDMQLLGPRPVRPEVYAKKCEEIPGYHYRFLVRPGLIGPSQLFTAHGCPKLIRTIIDNRFIQQERSIWRTLYLLWVTARAIGVKAINKMAERKENVSGRGKRQPDRRQKNRTQPIDARFYIGRIAEEEGFQLVGKVVDMNSDYFRVRSTCPPEELPSGTAKLEMDLPADGSAGKETRRAFVGCERVREEKIDGSYDYVWRYRPKTALGDFVLHQHFLGESFA